MAYSNGRLPDSALVSISGKTGARLRPGAAAAWEVLRQAVFSAHGWYPAPTGISDAYRSYAVQESIFRARYTTSYLAGRPTKRWNGVVYYLLQGKATAAVPGTSNHGLGVTVDITGLGGFTGTRYKQLAAIATGLGWSNAEGRSIGEAWHWTFTGDAEATSNDTSIDAGEIPTVPDLIAPDPLEEDPMSTPEVLAELKAINARMQTLNTQITDLRDRTDVTVEIIGTAVDSADKTKGQRFYLVDWAAGTRLHLSPTALAYLRARRQLDVIEWQSTETVAVLKQL